MLQFGDSKDLHEISEIEMNRIRRKSEKRDLRLERTLINPPDSRNATAAIGRFRMNWVNVVQKQINKYFFIFNARANF